MLSAPSRPRPNGLPSSPRPQKPTHPAQGVPFNAAEFPSASLMRSRPEYLTPGLSSLHARSRSQPSRIPPSPTHARHASNPTHAYNEDDTYADLALRNRGWPSSRTSQIDRQQAITVSRGNSPMSLSRSTTPEPLHITHSIRNATVNKSPGDGYAIWNTVTNVANALTISVNKAWSANTTTFSGEETPPGHESRLIRAMKAYHIAKAQGPFDLPDWLFNEQERRAAVPRTQPDDAAGSQLQIPPQSSDGDTTRSERWPSTLPPYDPVPSQPRLRGTDRLKAMRDAKRGIGDSSESLQSDTRLFSDSMEMPQPATRQPRLGLPSGSQRGRQ